METTTKTKNKRSKFTLKIGKMIMGGFFASPREDTNGAHSEFIWKRGELYRCTIIGCHTFMLFGGTDSKGARIEMYFNACQMRRYRVAV